VSAIAQGACFGGSITRETQPALCDVDATADAHVLYRLVAGDDAWGAGVAGRASADFWPSALPAAAAGRSGCISATGGACPNAGRSCPFAWLSGAWAP